jgi:hypothetical protein
MKTITVPTEFAQAVMIQCVVLVIRHCLLGVRVSGITHSLQYIIVGLLLVQQLPFGKHDPLAHTVVEATQVWASTMRKLANFAINPPQSRFHRKVPIFSERSSRNPHFSYFFHIPSKLAFLRFLTREDARRLPVSGS